MKVCPNLLDALVVSGGASTSVAANPATNASGSESSQNSLAPFGHSRGPQLKKPSKILLKRREMSGAGGGSRTIRAHSFYVTYCKHTNARTAQPAVCPRPMYKIMYNEIGRCGVAHRLRCYEDCEKLLRVRFKSPSLGSDR